MISASPNFKTANALLQKKPVIIIQITGYSRTFATNATDSNPLVITIESIEDQSTTVSDLDGGANLGELAFTVSDRAGLITSDFPTFIFEGKPVVVKTGFVGLSTVDFATLFTGVIDTVASANDNNSYTFTCVDNKQALSKVIYTVADDGRPTDSDHRRTLNAHPIDLFISALEDEVGLLATDINILKLLNYRDTIFAGLTFTFSLDSPPVAKEYLEHELMRPLGGYMWVNNLGQVDVNFFYPNVNVAVFGGALLGAFVDGSGLILGAPFPVGLSTTLVVPVGAVNLSMGVNDHFFTDNIGEWIIDVSGTTVHVGGAARPWNSAANPTLSYSQTGSTSPVTTGVTPGATIVLTYISQTVQIGVGFALTDPIGILGMESDPSGPGKYAHGTTTSGSVFSINHDNIKDEGIPLAEQADLVNTVHFKFDKDSGGTFRADDVESYALSTARYGQFGTLDIEADGMRSGFQGFFQSAVTARLIFYRYGLKNLKFEQVPLLWGACLLEPGDIVDLTSPLIPDREAGVRGITGKLFEVLDRAYSFDDHIVTVLLLDASYRSRFGNYLIAPNGMADYASASAANKAKYMFMAADTDLYSDASAAHVLG